MKRRLLVIGICGVAAVALSQWSLEHYRREIRGGDELDVLILNRDCEPGTVLDEGSLEVTVIPQAYVDERRVRAKDRPRILGATLLHKIRAGESLLWSDLLGDAEAPSHLSGRVEAGLRAYQLGEEANPFRTLIRVGDRVDVLSSSPSATELIAENLTVLAVGDRLGEEARDASRRFGISLSVNPDEATRLFQAERKGKLRVVLRHPTDERRQFESVLGQREGKRGSAPLPREIEHVR